MELGQTYGRWLRTVSGYRGIWRTSVWNDSGRPAASLRRLYGIARKGSMDNQRRFGMRIGAIASYAPRQKVSNSRISARLRLEKMRVNKAKRDSGQGPMDSKEEKLYRTSDRWIRRFIGFGERRFAADGEATIDLAARAALLLLSKADLNASDIDGIVFGTVTPSYLNSPPDSALLQDRLGIPPRLDDDSPREFHALDVSLACSTWVIS